MRLFDGFAAVGKALSSGRRLELLDVLAQGPRSVERLAEEIGQSVANTSAHLRALLAADYLGDRSQLETITRAELAERLTRDPPPLVVDVRPAAEFLAGHVPGAVSVPPDEVAALADRVRRLPADGDVVAYCRGPFCVYAGDAVRVLRQQGRRAARLEDGFPEWRRAGLPVAMGDQAVGGEEVAP